MAQIGSVGWRVRCDRITRVLNRLAQKVTGTARFNPYFIFATVNLNLGVRIYHFEGTGDGFFAMAAGHTGYGKGLLHKVLHQVFCNLQLDMVTTAPIFNTC